jgi:hypothetical protein
MEVENPMQPEGVVDVDAIPSPVIEPVSPTVVEEKEPTPVTEQMEIDPQNMDRGEKPDATTQHGNNPANK